MVVGALPIVALGVALLVIADAHLPRESRIMHQQYVSL
jgi:hypothetical protein